MFKRGKEFERGLRPLSLLLPSPANINTQFYKRSRLERGFMGEA
jgi:hypothetical protein